MSRWEGERKGGAQHVWEAKDVRHAARRFSLSGTAPPFRGGKVTATPYAPVALLVADRPFSPPRSPLECSGPRQAARRWASAPHAPAPLPFTHTQARHAHTRQTRRPALKRKRKNGKEETSGGDSPPMQHPREGLPSPKLCLSITPKPAAARGALGAACRTAVARGQAPEDEWIFFRFAARPGPGGPGNR